MGNGTKRTSATNGSSFAQHVKFNDKSIVYVPSLLTWLPMNRLTLRFSQLKSLHILMLKRLIGRTPRSHKFMSLGDHDITTEIALPTKLMNDSNLFPRVYTRSPSSLPKLS